MPRLREPRAHAVTGGRIAPIYECVLDIRHDHAGEALEMKLELIDATPVRTALDEITDLEAAQLNGDVRLALGNARALLAKALDDAVNLQFTDGIDVDTYAKLHNPPLTPDGVRKRIQRGTLAAEKRGGRYFIIDPAA